MATKANPDAVPANTPLSAENICRRCAGSGSIDGRRCPDCAGTGKVTTPVGGAG
jgi:DnaJ-class molecular chaperone